MDYIRQLLGFRRKRMEVPISTNAIALYLVLFEFANELSFPPTFSAANTVFMGLSGLSATSFKRTRDELILGGYLDYKAGVGNRCGTYSLVGLSDFEPQSGPQVGHSAGSLNKEKEKREKQTFCSSSLENLVSLYRENIGKVTPRVRSAIEELCELCEESLICYAIEEAVLHEKRSLAYVSSIVKSHVAAGRKAREAAESSRKGAGKQKKASRYDFEAMAKKQKALLDAY